jgi:hypothetical protein
MDKNIFPYLRFCDRIDGREAMQMAEINELTHDILMGCHNVHGNKARIHERVTYLARERVVQYHTDCARKRALPFLPLKYTENNEYLKIPENIFTADQLWDYVKKKKPFWLHHCSR